MTNDDHKAWLARPAVDRCYLVEASYLLDGQLHTLRRSTHPYRSHAADTPSYTPYGDTIVSMGEYERDMPEALTGQSRYQQGGIELALDAEVWQLCLHANFSGLPVRILVGEPQWPLSDFMVLLSYGLGEDLSLQDDIAQLTFSDRAAIFERSILVDTVPGTGAFKPICYGRCFGVAPVLIDAQQGKYMVCDGPCSAIVVKESGVPINVDIDLATGTFVLATAVSGTLTADVDGLVADGVWLRSAEQIINHLLTSGLGVEPIANPGQYPDYLMGLCIRDDITYAQVFDQLITNTGWYYDRLNQFRLSRLTNAAQSNTVLTPDDIVADSVEHLERLLPVASVRVDYQRNWSVLESVAGVIRQDAPADAERLMREYNSVHATNDNVLNTFPAAQSITLPALIVNQADAQAEADYTAALYSRLRHIYKLEALAVPFAFELGKEVGVDDPEHFVVVEYGTVTRLIDSFDEDTCVLEVLL